MKKILILALLAVATFVFSSSKEPQKPYNRGVNVTPMPLEMSIGEGAFELSPKVVFVCTDKAADRVAEFFANKIKNSTGYDLKIVRKQPAKEYISLIIASDVPVNDEGYLLDATAHGVVVKARTPRGLFYAMQTFMQLLPAEIESKAFVADAAWSVPTAVIRDEPRLGYRGQMLDVCRHFVDVENIKKQLDILAMYKVNRFHWHLTEDQAWRVEIKKYPLLTEISAKRTEGEGITYGPYFYTQDQIREVVAYAKERFIEVIPEIELPGHAVAALTAYPQFSCTGGPFDVRNIWGISNDIYCAGNEATFGFLTDILEEIIPLFESEYFHIGGDEAPKMRWAQCFKCQARIAELGLTTDSEFSKEEKLQSYFIKRMEAFLQSHNKRLMGWDEILEGGLAPTATVMSWRGEKGGIKAATMGRDVIMTPNEWLYLDNYQGDEKIMQASNRRYIPISKTYSYDPVSSAIADDKKKHVIGVQANVWAEYMYTPDIVEWCVYPRIIALSEIAWSAPHRKDYGDFERRIDNQRVRLDHHNINYYIPMPQDKGVPSCNRRAFTDKITLEFATTEPVKIVYTTDRSEPNGYSKEYATPLVFTESATVKVRSVLMSGKLGDVRTITVEKQRFAPAVEKSSGARSGLKAEYYKGLMRNVSELDCVSPVEVEWVKYPKESKYTLKRDRDATPEDNYNTVLTGYVNIPEDGVYYFSSRVDQLWLDDELFISNEGKVKRFPLSDRSVALSKGVHKIKVIRLSGIVGGWHPLWEPIAINIRKEGEPKFRELVAEDFR